MATSDLRELILSARHRFANAKQDPVAAIHRDEFLEMIRAPRSHLAAIRGMTDAELLEYVEDIFDGSLVVAGLIPDPKAADGARACIPTAAVPAASVAASSSPVSNGTTD